MSISREFYIICGYDITGCKTDSFDEWYHKYGENWVDFQTKGNIQLFTDPMNGDYLYLGYIIGSIDDVWCGCKCGIDINDIEGKFYDVHKKLNYLVDINAISEEAHDKTPEVFAFVEYR